DPSGDRADRPVEAQLLRPPGRPKDLICARLDTRVAGQGIAYPQPVGALVAVEPLVHAGGLDHDPTPNIVLERVLFGVGQKAQVQEEMALVQPDCRDARASGNDLANIPDALSRP